MNNIDYSDLIGLAYKPEVHDCFQMQRNYFSKLGISIRDYAFPSDWWETDDNLYLKHYADEGFYSIVTDNWKPQLHDVMLVQGSLSTTTPTHAGVLCEPNKVLHHYTGRLSEVTAFKSPWRQPAIVLRHKNITIPEKPSNELTLAEMMPDHVREKFEQGLGRKLS